MREEEMDGGLQGQVLEIAKVAVVVGLGLLPVIVECSWWDQTSEWERR